MSLMNWYGRSSNNGRREREIEGIQSLARSDRPSFVYEGVIVLSISLLLSV